MTSTPSTPDDAIRELQESWHSDQPASAEQIFQRHPHVADNNSAAVDVIYAEILLREHSGDQVDEDEYVQRFPRYAEFIRRQFQLHRALVEDDLRPRRTDPPDDTFSESPPSPPVQQPEIPGFVVHDVAGKGGTGIAYRAFDEKLKRVVAIKVLRLDDPKQQARLLREAQAAAALEHAGIVGIHQVGQHQGRPFLVMEFIDGESLETRLQNGPMPVEAGVRLMVAVGQAVQSAHQQDIIHRDLKPGNVLLDSSQQPHVCDFGLARQLDADLTAHTTGEVLGTPAFMPPEQAAGDEVDHRADVYALGATLYNVLTGRPPFQAATPWEILNQVMTADPVAPRRLNPAVPKDLDTICAKALHKNPDRRFGSVQQLVDELQRVLAGQPIVSRPTGSAERFWKLCRRNPLTSALITVTAVALVAVATISYFSSRTIAAALTNTESALIAAETQRDVAVDAMQNLVTDVNDDLTRYEASVEAREGVLRSAIGGLERIVETSGQQEDILSTMCAARCQYGFILAQQGRNQEATAQYLKARQLAEAYDSETADHELVYVLNLLAQHYLRIADTARALETGETARGKAEQLVKVYPDSLRAKKMLGTVLTNYGNALTTQAQPAKGITQLAAAQSLMQTLHQQHPDDPAVTRLLIDVDIALASLYFNTQQLAAAEEAAQEARQLIQTDEFKIEQDTQLFRKFLNTNRLSVVTQFARMNYDEAIAVGRTTQQHYQRLVEVEPQRPGFRLKLGVISDDLAKAELALGRLDQAAANFEQAVEQFREGMRLGGPEYRVQRYAIAQSLSRLADVQMRQDRLKESAATLGEVAKTIEPLIEEYKLQEPYQAVLRQVEFSKAIAGMEHSADEATAKKVIQSYNAWLLIRDGRRSEFIDLQPQLKQNIDATDDSVVKPGLQTMYALSLGRLYQHEVSAADVDPEQIARTADEAIAAISTVLSTPGADLAFHLTAPDFQALRKSDHWQTAFPSQ